MAIKNIINNETDTLKVGSTTYPTSSSKGDIVYASADNTLATLSKDSNATRYLANTGVDNVPKWDQVSLTDGVTGTLGVSNGGTGAATFTANGVLYGNTTSAIQATAAGATGQLLVGVTGSAPSFSSSSDGDFTFTTATNEVNRTLAVTNTDDTAGKYSAAHIHIQTKSDSTGDPYIRFDVGGGQDYSIGIDNSASDVLKITDDVNPSAGNILWSMSSAGQRKMPLQPCFFAYLNTSVNNVTGKNTSYKIVFDRNRWDIGNDYNTENGLFTAPVAGYYLLGTSVYIMDANTITYANLAIVCTGIVCFLWGSGSTANSLNSMGLEGSSIVWLDYADTAYINIRCNGAGSKVVDIHGSTTHDKYTYFWGYLLG